MPIHEQNVTLLELRAEPVLQHVSALYKWTMATASAMHTAARRYCMEQHAFWTAKYADFPAGGPYSQEAYRIFPRYRLADDTLVNIERCVFNEATSSKEAKDILVAASAEAVAILSSQMKDHDAAIHALESHHSAYVALIESLASSPTSAVEPLPFRRVLPSEEVDALWQVLRDRWGIRGAGYGWFPISEDAQPVGSLTFHEELWTARQGGVLFRRFLMGRNVFRCYMLRELGPPDYELDSELARPVYDGSESFLFRDSDWLVYASHESSLTLAGSIADFFRERWSDADSLGYGGPFHTDDLRGTWKWPT
jgi:hypothetical protein